LVQLQMDLEKANEKNVQLSQEISSRGDQMEGHLMEALRLKDEAEGHLKFLDDRVEELHEELQAELKHIKAEHNSTSATLSQSKKRSEDLSTVLEQLQEQSSNLEDELNSAKLELRCANDAKEELLRQLHDNTELDEAKRTLETQKSAHQFNLESLAEDQQCLMELVDELKGKLETSRKELTDQETEKCALKAEIGRSRNGKMRLESRSGRRKEKT